MVIFLVLAWLLAPSHVALAALSSHWLMDAGTGTELADSVGTRTLTFASAPNVPGWSTACRTGACVTCDGAGDVASHATGWSSGTTFSLAAWILPLSSAPNLNYQSILANGSGFFLQGTGDANAGKLLLTDNVINAYSTQTVILDQWNHVAVSDATNVPTFYVNGVASVGSTLNAQVSLRGVCSEVDGSHLHGSIDDLRYYTHAITAAEVQAILALTPVSKRARISRRLLGAWPGWMAALWRPLW